MATTTMTATVTTITDAVQLDRAAAEALIVKFNEAKAAIKLFEADKAEAEAAIRALLGGATVGLIDGVERIRVQHRNLSKIDREALKTAFPEAYAAVLTESAYTVLQAK